MERLWGLNPDKMYLYNNRPATAEQVAWLTLYRVCSDIETCYLPLPNEAWDAYDRINLPSSKDDTNL